MNERTINKLELPKILELLSEECSSGLGKKRAAESTVSFDYEEIIRRQRETTEGVLVRRFEPNIPLGGISDVAVFLKKAAIGGTLTGDEFLRVAAVLRASRRMKNFLLEGKKQYEIPKLKALAENLTIISELEKKIEKILSEEGEVQDSASPLLASLRRKIGSIQNKVREKLESIIRSEKHQKHLQDSIVTIRGDRYVVPVKQEYRKEIPGIVHDYSSSGATLFVEPLPVLELNNELRKVKAEESEEVFRILRELSEELAQKVEEIADNLDILAELDYIFARARLSEKMEAVEPRVLPLQKINIIKGRHPLIERKNVVPLSISLGREYDALIVTGPNTGGKTVSLKTVGLFILMMQSGLHVPAEPGTSIGIFRKIYADIGDEQSIEQSLSTFSSHLTNIVDILKNADKDTLILLDELGAGTDPAEGSVLAIAIIEDILQKKSKLIATTHYGELKLFAFQKERVENASMEFDIETLKPTYRLLQGIPGKSNALEIASRLGLKQEVVDNARSLLRTEEKDAQSLIENLETSQRLSELRLREAEEMKRQAEKVLESLQERERNIEEKREKARKRALEEAVEIVREARKESEDLLREIRMLAKDRMNDLDRTLIEKKKRFDDKINGLIGESRNRESISGDKIVKVKAGQEVWFSRVNQNAIVLEEPDEQGNLKIQVGIIKMQANLEELSQLKGGKVAKGSVKKNLSEKMRTIKAEIDLRGMLVEEASERVDKYLDDALLSGLNQVSIIHGKGTGSLREGIREMLRNHPHVRDFRLGSLNEGGAGVTIVEIKK